jgi:hypothetical protein
VLAHRALYPTAEASGFYGGLYKINEQFPRCYSRKVAEGNLVTIFGNWEEVTADKINAIAGAKYLYSEPLHH